MGLPQLVTKRWQVINLHNHKGLLDRRSNVEYPPLISAHMYVEINLCTHVYHITLVWQAQAILVFSEFGE